MDSKKLTRAIVCTPCENMKHGLTTANLGVPDYQLALEQHQKYVEALEQCGLEVTVLPPDPDFPDSVFVEDTALLTPECAVITHPGAPSRRGEVVRIENVLSQHFRKIEAIRSPGTVDAGDILDTGTHCYIGLSNRTNKDGAMQLIRILENYGMAGSAIPLTHVLHLKSGVSYLGDNRLIVSGEFIDRSEFRHFRRLRIEDEESYAANLIRVNDRIIMPRGYPESKQMIEGAGYCIIEVELSEFRKMDGGVSCLSLRF